MDAMQNYLLTRYDKTISAPLAKKSGGYPFKDNELFPLITDILSRQNQHHVLLQADFFPSFAATYIDAFSLHLATALTPPALHHATLIYLDFGQSIVSSDELQALEQPIKQLFASLDLTHHYYLFFILAPEAPGLQSLCKQLTAHAKSRVILLARTTIGFQDDSFTTVKLPALHDTDTLAILKQQRSELEQFHHVIIPDELLSQAHNLAQRYLSTHESLEKTLLLLDSSAARAGISEQTEDNSQLKPILTTNTLLNVLSHWVQIPATHLHWQQWKQGAFQQNMQQKLFGQDAAITLIGQELQQFSSHLTHQDAPLCRLLFAGPKHAGKKTAAVAMTDYLYQKHAMLYCVQFPVLHAHSLTQLKLRSYQDRHPVPLTTLIQQTPYAVLMFEHIEQAAPAVLQGLSDMITNGFLHDEQGNYYDFRHAILVLTTTLGTKHLTALSKNLDSDEEAQHFDLMQLIMNEQKQDEATTSQQYAPHELAQEILPDLMSHLPAALCQHVAVIPFLPLNKSAIEKMLRQKLKLLGKQLFSKYSIELSYAPEVVRYLVKQVLLKQEEQQQAVNIDKVIKPLYYIVEQTVVSQADNANRPNQLFLQLNETGQLLRCDWMLMTSVRQHTT